MLKVVRRSTRLSPKYTSSVAFRSCTTGEPGILGQRAAQKWNGDNTRLFTSLSKSVQQQLHEAAVLNDAVPLTTPESRERAKNLPLVCPGCGAPSQTIDADAAGYYGSKRAEKSANRVKVASEEDEIFQNALESGALSAHAPAGPTINSSTEQVPDVPICDRCHYLRHQSRGTSVIHPSMQSIQDIIEESPHKRNHIYHVLDAADFPMSLIPNLQHALKLPRLRTQNRRSKSMLYVRGRVAEVSFIITRSDLLAPKKEQVDSLVPYLREVLRDALGRSGRNVRLGNVRCVSAKRGWWTKTVKEDVWERGGAGWMVGKANVGKSALYEVVFPKGRNDVDTNINSMRNRERQILERNSTVLQDKEGAMPAANEQNQPSAAFADSPGDLSETHEDPEYQTRHSEGFQETEIQIEDLENEDDFTFFSDGENGSLLPPAQPETAYPQMPLVSALPGTTASPIRIPFGNSKGELIDLPGVQRTFLDTYIEPVHHKDLVMKSRVVPEQYTLKPGQSLLIGGTIRITPKTDELIFLAYPFVPLEAHATSNEKAVAIQTGVQIDGQPYIGTVDTISTEAAKRTINSAGTFQLKWDVTKRRAGPLTDKAAGKQKAANLPFIVYSADLLIESVGWVELVCQVRSRRKSFVSEAVSDAFGEGTVRREQPFPEVEVWSPDGKFVGVRRPMGAWLLGGPKKVPKYQRRARPRQSISMAKRKAGGAANAKRTTIEQ